MNVTFLQGYTGERSTVNKFRTFARILHSRTLLAIGSSQLQEVTFSLLEVHNAEVLQE